VSERRFRSLAAMIAVAAALVSFVYAPFMTLHTYPDSKEYVALARAISHGRYSSRIFDLEVRSYSPRPREVDVTGISWPPDVAAAVQRDVYRTPGYPLLLAAVGGGGPGASRHVLYAVQALLMGLTALLLTLLARRLWGPSVALVAGSVFALDPYSKRFVTIVLTETLAGFLFTATAYCVVRAWQQRSIAWWAGAGLLAGVLTLVRPVFALTIPLLAIGALCAMGGRRQRLLAAGVALAAGLVLVAPWVARNAAVSGKATLAGYGPGWNLLIAAHGEGHGRTLTWVYAQPSYQRDFAAVQRLAPTPVHLRADGNAYARYLVRADALQRSEAVHLYVKRLGENPGQVLWEVAYRAYALWMAHTEWSQPAAIKLLQRFVDWALLLLAGAAVVLELRRGGAGRALAVFLVLYTVVSALGHVEPRYTIPLRGLYLAFAVSAAAALVNSVRQRP
jgi:4-amino-4-deoxy-L-arabinose transferase-like glycosyltransferase